MAALQDEVVRLRQVNQAQASGWAKTHEELRRCREALAAAAAAAEREERG